MVLACVKSKTSLVITVTDSPVLWQSSLQSETALSNMQTRVIALVQSDRELAPIIDMADSLDNVVGLPKDLTIMYLLIYENNAGALILAETQPPY